MRVAIFGGLMLCFVARTSAQIQTGNIEIIRDQWGVPHIYAPTDQEVAYGLAWAHAEDDFENIQFMILAAKQMLGRHLGKEGAMIDYLVALLRCREVVNDHYNELSIAYRNVIEGYVAGLNAYARENPKEVLVKGAFPVTAQESLRGYVLQLAAMAGVGSTLGSIMDGEVARALSATGGSNAFALGRSLTATGEVFLGINSHQPLEGPAAWYEAHLISDEGWNMMGGLFPGGATIFHGTNEFLGWAHTVNYPDKIDVYELETDPDDPMRYRIEDEWYELEKRDIKLKVKILPGINIGVKRDVFWSVYGPALQSENGTFAFDLSVLHDVRAPDQWYQMNKARSFEEFYDALKILGIPGFNIVYGDRDGNIFYLGNGKLPFRDPAFDWKSTLPGNTIATQRSGYHPLEDLPQILNPSSGYVFNTNHSAYYSTAVENYLDPSNYDSTMGYMAWHNNRSLRFSELMNGRVDVTWEEFLAMKYDARLPDSLGFLIDINPLFEIDPRKLRHGKAVLEIIQQWNRRARESDIGPVHLSIFYDHLRRKLDAPKAEITRPTQVEMLESLAFTEDYLLKHFGKLDVRLEEYQFLVHGEKELPIWGISEVLTAIHSVPYKEGRVRAYAGESYIMMVRYREGKLPVIETINVYGASNDPQSPHYSDQMDMFVAQQRKPMTLDLDSLRAGAVRIYHPK